jgi:cyclomaltodextrinase
MEDFVFGTLATDDLKLMHHRARRRGIQHAYQIAPRDPKPNEPITLTVNIGPDLAPERVVCHLNGDLLDFEKKETLWDTLVWGYVEKWTLTLAGQPDGTVLRYRISAIEADGRETFADFPEVQTSIEIATSAFFRNEPLPFLEPGDRAKGNAFTLSVDTLTAPQWAKDAIIYQVFVDRFFPGKGNDWKTPDDLLGFFGGTLWGVIEKLDYIEDLGVNTIWLSPIFDSPSHHGYDATDIYNVAERYGGNEALRALVDAAHARGIRILLDFVCSHISHENPIFVDALNNEDSEYRDWFMFDDSEHGYRSFFGVKQMPQLNYFNPAARKWMIDAARYWIHEFDVDGYRLDYAIGPTPDFWTDFWLGCKAEKADAFCFGETIDAPDVQMHYHGRLDGCLDFFSSDALRRTYGFKTRSEADLERFIERHTSYFPGDFVMPTFLDNHDMDRFLHINGGDKDALKKAAQIQMQLPGPPIIYYGTEVGLTHEKSSQEDGGIHVSRVPMAWGAAQDQDLLAFYKKVIAERKNRK